VHGEPAIADARAPRAVVGGGDAAKRARFDPRPDALLLLGRGLLLGRLLLLLLLIMLLLRLLLLLLLQYLQRSGHGCGRATTCRSVLSSCRRCQRF
jgi:hypothetical protein